MARLRRTRGMKGALGAVAAAVLLGAGCTVGSDSTAEPTPAPAEPPPADADPAPPPAPDSAPGWKLVSARGPGGEIPLGRRELTLVLRPRQLSGFGGCNEFGARARIEGERVRLRGPLTSTLMGCGEEINAVEDAYLDALREVERQEMKDGRLVLTGPETELLFEPLAPVDPERLDGRTWTLESWTVDGATRTARARPATLRFGRDGRVEARTRCRDLAGRYIVQGHEVVLTEAQMSRRDHAGCSREAIEQEGAVVGALGDRFRVDVEGDRLRIESRDGYALVLRAD